MLNKIFNLKQSNTTVRTEVVAGVTTFLTMAYIMFVNPTVLGTTGMPVHAVFVATCLIAALGCFLTGLFSNLPMAVAPGMALNVYFAFVIVKGLGFTWEQALAASFIASVLFFMIAITPIRHWILKAIPETLNIAVTVGLGIFIGLIALKSAGLIVSNPKTLMTLGHLNITILLFLFGFFTIIVADYYRVPGAILIGVLSTTLLGLMFGHAHYHGIVSSPPSILPTFNKMNFHILTDVRGYAVIFAFLFVTLFDSTGTFIGLLHHSKIVKGQKDEMKRISRGLVANSLTCVVSGVIGTSSTSPYLESATGIKAGGRTGLTAVVIAVLFLGALFLSPLAATVPAYATAPALLYVATLMLKNVVDIKWDDVTDAIPSVLTLLIIPLSFSIAAGIGAGLISYVVIKLLTGKFRDLNVTLVSLTLLFVGYFVVQAVIL